MSRVARYRQRMDIEVKARFSSRAQSDRHKFLFSASAQLRNSPKSFRCRKPLNFIAKLLLVSTHAESKSLKLNQQHFSIPFAGRIH